MTTHVTIYTCRGDTVPSSALPRLPSLRRGRSLWPSSSVSLSAAIGDEFLGVLARNLNMHMTERTNERTSSRYQCYISQLSGRQWNSSYISIMKSAQPTQHNVLLVNVCSLHMGNSAAISKCPHLQFCKIDRCNVLWIISEFVREIVSARVHER